MIEFTHLIACNAVEHQQTYCTQRSQQDGGQTNLSITKLTRHFAVCSNAPWHSDFGDVAHCYTDQYRISWGMSYTWLLRKVLE